MSSEAFVLLPLRDMILRGDFYWLTDAEVAVLPVLVAHMNQKTRQSFPSHDRIAVLAGIGKKSVADGTTKLRDRRWLDIRKEPAPGGRTRHVYRLYIKEYSSEERSIWLGLPAHRVFLGVWAALTPSARRLYLVLLALSWNERAALVNPEMNPQDWQEFEPGGYGSGRFVPAERLDPRELGDLAGIEPRTFQRAWNALLEHGLIEVNTEEVEGILMPDTKIEAPAVLARLKKLDDRGVTPGARRLLSRTRNRKLRHGTPKSATSGAVFDDITKPEPSL